MPPRSCSGQGGRHGSTTTRRRAARSRTPSARSAFAVPWPRPSWWRAGSGGRWSRGRAGGALAAGDGIPPRPVHRADGDGDRQHRGACRSGALATSRRRCGAWRRWSRRGRPAGEMFAEVAEEVASLLGLEVAAVRPFEPDGWGTIVGRWGDAGDAYRLGARMKQEGESVTTVVYRTGRSARFDDYGRAGTIRRARRLGFGGRREPDRRGRAPWGAIAAGTSARAGALGHGVADRGLRRLVAAAISNVRRGPNSPRRGPDRRRRRRGAPPPGARSARRRAAAARAHRRHAHARSASAPSERRRGSVAHRRGARAASRATRSCGSWPTASFPRPHHGGLRAGITRSCRDSTAGESRRSERAVSPEIEASAYFIVAEALTNVVKHAHAGTPRSGRPSRTGRCASGFATTGSAAPIRAVTGWWGSATE